MTLAAEVPPAIEPAPRALWYPLSSGQLAMWLVAQVGASHAAYAVPAVYELTGALDTGALRRAVELLVARHESLRTAIAEVDGVPMQRAIPDRPLDWRFAAVADAGEAGRCVRDFVELDFDLATGEVLRALLIERSATEHILVVSTHHIACDGWSITVLIDEIAAAYNSFTGAGRPLPTLALQYKDYSCWQQRLLEDGAVEEAQKYWLGKLSGALEPLDLPADRPRPAVRTFRGGVTSKIIPLDLLDALKALCREEKVTLYAGLCAVLRVLFFRYTGQRDFVVGTSAVGRPVEELYDQIGYYINTLALRDTVTPELSFRDVLKAAQVTLLDAMRHSDYPFDRVVRDAGVVTDSSRNALFDVMIFLESGWGAPTAELAGLGIRQLDPPIAHSKLDLSLFFKETAAGLKATVEYSTDIFDADRIERLLEHLTTLVAAAAETPDRTVEALPLLPAGERRRVLVKFNDTDTEYQLDTPVHQLFEQQADKTPERVATVDDHQALTYAELNAKANALAWTLREDHGVGPGTLVALHLDRSVDLMVAILGVLKSGGAYLPISMKDPAERIDAILSDSAAKLVLDSQSLDPSRRRADNPPPLAGPDDLAYCIYTSGSTGKPNGVLIEHRGLINRLRWMIDDLGLDEADVILQKTPYVFDVSVWELLLPGMIGAKQVMLRPAGESDPEAIRDTIARHGVTALHFVPSMLSQYLAAVEGGFGGVRACVCSGEELGADLAQRFFAATTVSRTGLHNYYGPTEATVDVSLLRVEEGREPVTIGRPAPNNRLYIVGAADEPCPIGVPGELCIGGIQLARGYLNRQELTARRFVADPFRPGERMYRTGDLARWLPNGEVVYLGRLDRQIKVRGFRVELGEIEQALVDQDGVERAVVLAQRDASGADFLCAYLEGSACPPPDRLRGSLSARLPEYMVPSHYVLTESIPVTRNGKVDRKALIALGGAQVATGRYVPAGTDVERDLVDIWRSLLPVGRLGITDDFFVVGGHSLSALQLSSRISRTFGVPVTVASIFKHRTVADQARLIAEAPAAPAASALSAIRPVPRAARHPLSFAQERMWFLHMLDPDGSAYNIRLLAKLTGFLDVEAFRQAVHDLVERHELLRMTFVDDGGQTFQTLEHDQPVEFQIIDATRDAVGQAVHEASVRPFRLREEPPLRIILYRLSDTEHQLLIVLHHIAGDGWSLRLLLRELSTVYSARLGATTGTLPALAVQYLDYAEAVRHPDHQAAVDDDLAYWLDRLAGYPALELPNDAPVPESDRAVSGRVSGAVPPTIGRALRNLAEQTATTPFEIVMSAVNLVLSRLADQQDVLVGFPVADRESVELEAIVGLFLNTLVLRTDLSGRPSFTELLGRVSTGIRDAYEHQAAPFELLVERLNPVRQLDRAPVFDVMVNYLGDLREEVSLKDVAVEFDDEHLEPEAKFPLVFYVRDEGADLHLDLLYRTDLFRADRALMIVRQLELVLEQAALRPGDPIASYSLVPPESTVITDLGRALAAPEHQPVTDLITARAAAAPEHVAISQGAESVTYSALVTRAKAIARRLVADGCGPGDVIGVNGSRGIGFVAGLLGVLFSGAAVLPLDPELPEARRAHLLEVGKPRTFVRAEDHEHADDPTVVLPPVSSHSPAYLFFTSGTTGTPRGVLGWHGALSHFLAWQSHTFGITPDDRCAQTTGVSFDVMLRDTFLALVSGGTLVIPEPKDELGGKAVFGWLERERVSVLHAVPTVLQAWLADAPPGPLPDLRWTFLAGEPLKAALVETLRARYPGTEVVNLYGPTETTLAKFAYRVPSGQLPAVLPVGSPLPQCQAIVLRDEDVICGVGEPGEIVIRTPFRSLGYVHDPDGTFFQNPYRDDETDLLYRTGDLGRFRPDGLLEIVGRKDHQVKIGGVRIQPAEVENALAGHPSVSSCIVVAHKDERGEAHLVAYVVAARPDPALGERLRGYLTGLLPRAMVPGEYQLLDRIPTTPNGKPDRAALPKPLFARVPVRVAAEAPRTDAEERIRDLWATVLDRPVFGVNDNFFELGGTSLTLLRLYSRLDERFPGTFSIARLFTHSTIAAQAALVDPTHARGEDEVVEHEF